MRLIKTYGLESAREAEGTVVIIDVLRAFTTAAFAFHRGARQIFLVGTADEAYALKRVNPEFILVGEDGGRKIDGFDFGNSPEAIDGADLSGRTLVLRSSSGTQGVVSAMRAQQIYLGSLVVASATMRALASEPLVTLVAMGSPHGPDKEEDLICADYMESLVVGTPLVHAGVQKIVRESPAGQQALDPNIDFKTPGDLQRAIDIDRFNLVMPVEREGAHLICRARYDSV
jgi:2-phosphosulfolactate phosphatase